MSNQDDSARRWREIVRVLSNQESARYMTAARAESIPVGEKGLWSIARSTTDKAITFRNGKICPAGCYTKLLRWTVETLNQNFGECVMSDDPAELKRHLNAAMRASGNVLVTGLGLGCVLRMLQANPLVEKITLVEVSQDVIDLVWPHTPHDRVELIHADAVDFLRKTKRTWDYAWHDIWADRDAGHPHLDVIHQWMMFLCAGRVKEQGAWAFKRHQKRAIDRIMPRKIPAKVREATRKILRERGWEPISR